MSPRPARPYHGPATEALVISAGPRSAEGSKPLRRQPWLALATVGLALELAGCERPEAGGPQILLEISSEVALEGLEIRAKRYLDDRRVELFEVVRPDLPEGEAFFVVGRQAGRPLRLRLELPGAGRYAFHLVGRGAESGAPVVATATFCGEVEAETVFPAVVLGLLPPELDLDGDTFPEELARYCQRLEAVGLPCDLTCHGGQYSALLDCNPPEGFVPDPGCGVLPEPALWNPMVHDECADCFDQDCYGGNAPCEDRDGDGYSASEDCDDANPAVHPGAEEICGNGIDENCAVDLRGCTDGDLPCDADGDGFRAATGLDCGSDCDDSDPAVNPGAFEGCGADPDDLTACPGCGDGVDNNCNGRVDEGCFPLDIDDDGVDWTEDCNDCDSASGPGFPEVCGNQIDEDCSGEDLRCARDDRDGDGVAGTPSGEDCDDRDPLVFPGAPDRCGDGVAQDCVDDLACEQDRDGDSWDGLSNDCDDDDPNVHPWALELCDPEGVDEDCDGRVNESVDRGRGCGLEPASGRWYEIDFGTNIDHCGRCRHRCEIAPCYREGTTCERGVCSCDGGPACPGSAAAYCCPADGRPAGCRDLTSSTEDCGRCGRACHPGEVCRPGRTCGLGECVCPATGGPCPDGPCWACCGEAGCVNLCEDPRHCGGCEHDCTALPFPEGDACGGSPPRCLCGGTYCGAPAWCTEITEPPGCGCVDLHASLAHCGRCGNSCHPGETCSDDRCACGPTMADCDGSAVDTCCPGAGCRNLLEDPRHCGACGRACAFGETCVAGACRCGSGPACDPSRQDCCSGACYAVETDAAHCGRLGTGTGCTNACRPGSACLSGTCSCGSGSECGPGETCCSGATPYCANLGSDLDNCGACGTRCRAGEQCSSGSCVCTPSCSDGVSCTEDSCVGGRCVHRTLDADDDGYCAAACPDAASGSPGDCIDGDCDDSRASVRPGAPELCSTSYDDDCDGSTNDRDATGCTTFYLDVDGDGYGTSDGRCYCRASGNYRATVSGDCNDALPTVHPGAVERCNGVDDDCSGATPDGSGESWYGSPCDGADADLCLEGTWVCSGGAQSCTDPNDVDLELCDGLDNDCNPATPNGADDCFDPENPDCEPYAHICYCAAAGTTCPPSTYCCSYGCCAY